MFELYLSLRMKNYLDPLERRPFICVFDPLILLSTKFNPTRQTDQKRVSIENSGPKSGSKLPRHAACMTSFKDFIGSKTPLSRK